MLEQVQMVLLPIHIYQKDELNAILGIDDWSKGM